MLPTAVSPSTKCSTCHHLRSFHPDGGPCKAQCPAKCQAFQAPPPAPPVPEAPDPGQLTEALDTLTTVIQRAPTSTRLKSAANLDWMISHIPTLRRAAGASDRPLRQILADCRRPPAAPQGAEVASDDAQDTPGPTA